MSYKTHHGQIVRTVGALCVLTLNAGGAIATVIAPGSAIGLGGTTALAQPELAGVVIVDDVIPYQIFGSGGGPLLYEGNLQARIVRSNLTGNLIFNYRLRDPTPGLNGIVQSLGTHNFTGWATDVEFRTDGLGDKGPTRATRTIDGSQVRFLFGNSLFSSEESLFMHVATDAKDFAGGKTTLTLTNGSSVVLPTYQPVPEPGSVLLLVLGVVTFVVLRNAGDRRRGGN